MDEVKLTAVSDILRAYHLIDQCHDRQLITEADFVFAKSKLNDMAHIAGLALLE